MKHEAELLPAEVVPSHIITEVVFEADPELNAGIEHAIRSRASKLGWERKRARWAAYDPCCTFTRHAAISRGGINLRSQYRG